MKRWHWFANGGLVLAMLGAVTAAALTVSDPNSSTSSTERTATVSIGV